MAIYFLLDKVAAVDVELTEPLKHNMNLCCSLIPVIWSYILFLRQFYGSLYKYEVCHEYSGWNKVNRWRMSMGMTPEYYTTISQYVYMLKHHPHTHTGDTAFC